MAITLAYRWRLRSGVFRWWLLRGNRRPYLALISHCYVITHNLHSVKETTFAFLLRSLCYAIGYGRPTNPVGSSSGIVVVQLQSRTWPSASEHLRRSWANRSLGSEISQHEAVATSWLEADEYYQRHCYTRAKRSPSVGRKLPFVIQPIWKQI